MGLSFWELDVHYEKGLVAFSPPSKVTEDYTQSENFVFFFFQTVTLRKKPPKSEN